MNQDELRVLEERIKANPKSRSFLQLAEAYIEAGRQAEALDLLKRGEDFYPYYLAARITYGKLLTVTGDPDAAIAQFEFVNRTIPDNLIALKNLAVLYFDKKRLADARTAATSVMTLSPNDPDMTDLLGKIAALEEQSRPPVPPKRPAAPPPESTIPPPAAPPKSPVPAKVEPVRPPPVSEPKSDLPEVAENFPDDLFEAIREKTAADPPAPIPLEDAPQEESTDDDLAAPDDTEPGEPDLEIPGLPQTETMGDLLFDQGHLDAALAVYEAVFRKDPDNASVPGKIQTIHRMQEADEEATQPTVSSRPLLEDPQSEREEDESESVVRTSRHFAVSIKAGLAGRIVRRVEGRMSRDMIGYVESTRDGLPVDSSDSGRWADVLAAEGIEIVRAVGDMTRTREWGEFQGTVVWLERAILYGIPVGQDRALFLVLAAEANIGLCRLLIEESMAATEDDPEGIPP